MAQMYLYPLHYQKKIHFFPATMMHMCRLLFLGRHESISYMDVPQVENEGYGTSILNIQLKGANSVIVLTHYVTIGARARVM